MNKHLTNIQVRFNDTDLIGHLNNTSYATYAETARIQFFRDLKVATTRMILANLSMDFRYQAKYTDDMAVETSVMALGNSSIKLYQKMLSASNLAAEVTSVVVCFDYQNNLPIPIKDDMRKVLENYLTIKE